MESREFLWVFIDFRLRVMRSYNISRYRCFLFVWNWKLTIVFLKFWILLDAVFFIFVKGIIILIFDSDNLRYIIINARGR